MKQNTLSLLLLLIFAIGFYVIYLQNQKDQQKLKENQKKNNKKNKEDFESSEIITSEMKANEDYRQCLDQNAQLYYQSHGKYPGCHKTLRHLTNWGMGPQTNLGYGQMKYICPVSCLLKQPADCLQAKADNQNTVILDISRDLRDFKADTPAMKTELNKGFLAHDEHLNKLYGKEKVQEIVDYIYTSGRQISDPIFQKILTERTSVALGTEDQSEADPTATTGTPETAYTKPPELTLPAFIQFEGNNNENNMNTSNLLGM